MKIVVKFGTKGVLRNRNTFYTQIRPIKPLISKEKNVIETEST